MSEVRRVPGSSSPLEGRSGKILAVVVAGILVAIAKPWGTSAPAPTAPARATPSAPATPGASVTRLRNYDPDVFGLYEPTPRWELWPAGFLVSFGFATRIESLTVGPDAPSAPPDGSPQPSTPAASSTPAPAGSPPGSGPGTDEPVWPATITVSAGSHLSMLGINTPLGYAVAGVTLWQRDPTGGLTRVRVVLPPSPWPAHFTIMAMDDGNGVDPRESWPPGDYLLDLKFEPGAIARQVEILIDGPTDAVAPNPGSSAGATFGP
jgi:hypothetical protein